SATIAQISDLQTTIASAVEEQTATANEMARNVAVAAKGSAEIAQNITAVAQAAQSTAEGAGQTQQAAADLAGMAAELERVVGRFSWKGESAADPHPGRQDGLGGWTQAQGNGRRVPEVNRSRRNGLGAAETPA